MTKLTDFYDQLADFDWYYTMSGDNSVYHAGRQRMAQLTAIATESPEHRRLINAWADHMFTGLFSGAERPPKPERPHDEPRTED